MPVSDNPTQAPVRDTPLASQFGTPMVKVGHTLLEQRVDDLLSQLNNLTVRVAALEARDHGVTS